MATTKQSAGMLRLRKILGFLIGVFGALAILGVFFKIMKYDNYEIFMVAGFIGEAAAFVAMGVLELAGAFSSREKLLQESGLKRSAAELDLPSVSQEAMNAMLRDRMERVADEVTSSFRSMLEETTRTFHRTFAEQTERNIGAVMTQMTQETHRFGSEMHDFAEELEKARLAVHAMGRELTGVAGGSLADDAERLGNGMNVLGAEMEMASNAAEQMRTDLERMAARFHFFNHGSSPASNGSADHAADRSGSLKRIP